MCITAISGAMTIDQRTWSCIRLNLNINGLSIDMSRWNGAKPIQLSQLVLLEAKQVGKALRRDGLDTPPAISAVRRGLVLSNVISAKTTSKKNENKTKRATHSPTNSVDEQVALDASCSRCQPDPARDGRRRMRDQRIPGPARLRYVGLTITSNNHPRCCHRASALSGSTSVYLIAALSSDR